MRKAEKESAPFFVILSATLMCGVVAGLLFWLMSSMSMGESTLPEVEYWNAPAHPEIAHAMQSLAENAASGKGSRRSFWSHKLADSYTVKVARGDHRAWFRQFKNVAPGRGWYVHSVDCCGYLEVILPESELPELKQAVGDPFGWMRAEIEAGRTPQKPSSDHNLVNVGVNVDPVPGIWQTGRFWVATIAIFFAIVTFVCFIFTLQSALEKNW